MFCAEHLPATHDLHLMLVNTIRKDITSHALAQIAMGLEMVISSPSEVILPAVQDRLYDLLGHTSSVGVLASHPMRSFLALLSI